MSGLIVLIVIFAIIENIVSKNKKKAEQAKKRASTPQSAARPRTSVPPPPRAAARPKQTRVPYTKEEWRAYLNELQAAAPQPRPVVQPAAQPQEHHEGYNFGQEGESHEEHAEHLRRIEEEEAQQQQERDARTELRTANRDKLRTAVVMSEVLGKPVALRPRAGYHR